MTTPVVAIEMSQQLYDRLEGHANDRGMSATEFIEELVNALEHDQRMAAFGEAIRSADEGYWQEFRLWDSVSEDGADRG